MTLTAAQYVHALQSDGKALAAAAEDNLDRPVPTCPGWTVADLVQHTGWVHRHKAAVVRRGGTEPATIQYWEQPPAPRDSLLDWYREGLADLVEVLGNTDPQAPAFNWTQDHRVAFWQRRMAQETVVHRYDAEAAAGRFTPVDAALAADGIDEFLRIFVPRNEEPYAGPHGEILLAAQDVGEQWTLALGGGEPRITPGGATAEATIRANAADLLLVLWRRKAGAVAVLEGSAVLVQGFLDWNDLD